MNFLGVIPARMGSERFPGKILADLHGQPMIWWVYQQALKAACLEKLVVATDSEAIFKTVIDFGGNAVMTSSEHPTGLDRVIEIARASENFSHIINIQGDEPTVSPETICQLAELFHRRPDCQIATSAVAFQNLADFNNPNQVKVVLDKNQKALYFSRAAIPFAREGNVFSGFQPLKHQGLYAYSREVLLKLASLPPCELEKTEKLEQLRFLYEGYNIYVAISAHDSIGVDTPEDLEKVKKIMRP